MQRIPQTIVGTALAGVVSFSSFGTPAAAGVPDSVSGKGSMIQEERGPLYQGTINTGIKASDKYLDANVNLVVPFWSTVGADGTLGGSVAFLAPYASLGEGGELATSIGLGFRHLFNDQSRNLLKSPSTAQPGLLEEGVAIGANIYLDMLDTEADNQFWQLGFGLELGTRYVEWRGNYYLPLNGRQLAERRTSTETVSRSRSRSRTVQEAGAAYDGGEGYYLQDVYSRTFVTTSTTTTTIQHIFERYEKGLEGWDMEVAVLIPGLDQWCEVRLLGGYFSLENSPFGPQQGGTGDVEGWKAGLEVRPVPALILTGMWYEDERFLGSDWTVAVQLQIPFELGDLGDGKGFWGRISDAFKPRRRHFVERLGEPVRRQNAAIKVGSEYEHNSEVKSQSTQSNTRVISQSAGKLVLGPAPSGTEFKYYTSGNLQITKSGGGTQTLTGGSLFLNSQNQALYVSSDGTVTQYLGVITPPSGTNPNDVRFTPPAITSQLTFSEPNQVLTVTSNTLVLNPSGGGSDVIDLGSGFVKTGTGVLVLNSSVYREFVPVTYGSSVMSVNGFNPPTGGAFGNGLLILNGATALGGTIQVSGGTSVLNLSDHAWSLLDWSKVTTNSSGQFVYTGPNGTSVIIRQASATP
jgi:hypothetical protein